MRILHIITSMDPRTGGPCQGVRNLSSVILEHGHAVEVACLDDPYSPYLSQEKLLIHPLGKSRGAWGFHPDLKPWLEHNLPRFDAVILNGLWQYSAFVMAKLAQYPGAAPYFIYPHGMLDPWFQSAPGRRLKAIRNWSYWKLVEQNVVRRARAVFFTCAEEMRLAGESFRPYRPQNQINVGFGISHPPEYRQGMEAAFTQKCPDTEGQPYLLFLGRIDSKKGVDLLIKAYTATYHSSPVPTHRSINEGGTHHASPPHLVIAGPGLETEYGQAMQKLAVSLCPPNFVHWPGMLSGDAKWGALYHAQAFVLTSHQENFGIAVVEALACKTPVLISNQINIWREIVEDHAGLAGDDTSVGTEKLFHQWENLSHEKRAAMKSAARQCFEKRFGINGAAISLLNTLQQFIGTKPKPMHA
jgi:glycosyltransferase involved in cell wall biosynthesis